MGPSLPLALLALAAPQNWFAHQEAYVFERSGSTWAELDRFTAEDPRNVGLVGYEVALSGDTVLTGTNYTLPGGVVGDGAAYVHRVTQIPPDTTPYCTAGTSLGGCVAGLSSVGTPSASATSGFRLTTEGVRGDKDGVFFYGTNGRQANPWGNGTSYQCVVPPVVRTGLQPGTGTLNSCEGALCMDLNAWWSAKGTSPGAAGVVQAQLWYRDTGNTSNQSSSLSNAIEFTVAP